MNNDIKIWLEVGLESKNNLRFIFINKIFEKIGPLLASAMPAFHAFFGCDYLAAFSRKGKLRPYNFLKGDLAAQEAFARLGEGPDFSEETMENIERFCCKVYGKRKLTSINEVRLQIFASKYKPKKNGTKSITDVKSMDGSSMPPCQRVLQQKIKRTNLVATRWCAATEPFEPVMSPYDYGLDCEDKEYRIKWFEGEAAPRSLDIMLEDADDEENGGVDDDEDIVTEDESSADEDEDEVDIE